MCKENFVEQLARLDIRPTANRILILQQLAGAGRPLSMKELEQQLCSIDKSVISRSLTLFREHHLVHVIEDGSGTQVYELCHSHNHAEEEDEHLHFYCEQCHRTYCLTNLQLPSISLPPSFELHSASFLLKGICPRCKANKK